jgi:hypothetical protein
VEKKLQLTCSLQILAKFGRLSNFKMHFGIKLLKQLQAHLEYMLKKS